MIVRPSLCSAVEPRGIAWRLVLGSAFFSAVMPVASVWSAAPVAAQSGPVNPANAAATDRFAGLPRWASLRPTEARTRAGPGRNYPILWEYRRAGLPVIVLERFESWRRIRDPDGAEGWIQANLLQEQRTAFITGRLPVVMRENPGEGGSILWRLAPGISGAIGKCDGQWCHFETMSGSVRISGFVPQGSLWGVGAGEILP